MSDSQPNTAAAGSFLRDNLEAFAVAIAMALVIRHFCLEAFRIPTGSMMPTLLGDKHADYQGPKRRGDRILVDKLLWQRRDPRRWEVAVFRYPLNANQNFIKRIIGLPDEWLQIADGDIWTSNDEGKTWTIQRKPPAVLDQLLIPYYPQPAGQRGSFADVDCWDTTGSWRVDEEARTFAVDAKSEVPDELFFNRNVLPYPDVDTLRQGRRDRDFRSGMVGDVRIRFRAEITRTGTLAVEITEHGVPYRLVLAADGCRFEYEEREKGKAVRKHRIDLPWKVEAGKAYDVVYANADLALFASLNDDEFVHELATRGPPSEPLYDLPRSAHGDHGLRIEAAGCAATIEDLHIDRDVFYRADTLTPRIVKMPPDSYLMLGDNQKHSSDSRKWRAGTAYMKDGSVIRWETEPRDRTITNPTRYDIEAATGDTVLRIDQDMEGRTVYFRKDDMERFTSEPWPFVKRDRLIGRAFSVFWPIYLPPLSRDPTRIKLIR